MTKPQWLVDLDKPEALIWKARAIAEAGRADELEKRVEELEGELFRSKVLAVGVMPSDAILAWARERGGEDVTIGGYIAGGDPAYTWGHYVTVDGTSYKVAGYAAPGGYVLTWWK